MICHSYGTDGSAGQWSGVSLMGLGPMVAGPGVIGRLDWGGHPHGCFTHICPLHVPPCDVCLCAAEEPGPPPWCSGVLEVGRGGCKSPALSQHHICHVQCRLRVFGDAEQGEPQKSMRDGQCHTTHHHPRWRSLPQSGSEPRKCGPGTCLLTTM